MAASRKLPRSSREADLTRRFAARRFRRPAGAIPVEHLPRRLPLLRGAAQTRRRQRPRPRPRRALGFRLGQGPFEIWQTRQLPGRHRAGHRRRHRRQQSPCRRRAAAVGTGRRAFRRACMPSVHTPPVDVGCRRAHGAAGSLSASCSLEQRAQRSRRDPGENRSETLPMKTTAWRRGCCRRSTAGSASMFRRRCMPRAEVDGVGGDCPRRKRSSTACAAWRRLRRRKNVRRRSRSPTASCTWQRRALSAVGANLAQVAGTVRSQRCRLRSVCRGLPARRRWRSNMPGSVVAAVRGMALGGGCRLAMRRPRVPPWKLAWASSRPASVAA